MLGKLTTPDLKKYVLSLIERRRDEVVTSAAVGEDCAVLRLNDLVLITCDPITGAASNIGSLAIYICSNDVAACGGESIAAIITVIAPENAGLEEIGAVMKDAERTAKSLGIEIAGGHTEYSDAVNRIIISCTMIGVPFYRGRVFSSTKLKPGDSVLLTHSVAQEYVSIMAHDCAQDLQAVLSVEEMTEARSFKDKLSIIPEARICAGLSGVCAMHDVTEGGLIGALGELLDITGFGFTLSKSSVPVHEITQKVCRHYGKDPCGVISSGNLLIVTDRQETVFSSLKKAGIEVSQIGTIEKTSGFRVV